MAVLKATVRTLDGPTRARTRAAVTTVLATTIASIVAYAGRLHSTPSTAHLQSPQKIDPRPNVSVTTRTTKSAPAAANVSAGQPTVFEGFIPTGCRPDLACR